MIEVFTDGSSLGNPGPGGYGIILRSGKHYKEISQGFRKTTNNRMELLAVIVALESIKKENAEVRITTDSKYVVDAVTKRWVFAWKSKGYKGKKNPDLWDRFLKIYPKHKVEFVWVKGHAGHAENERCDELAVQAANGSEHYVDEYYEEINK